MNVKEVRRLALALPQTSGERHFHLTSLRVKGKIFATMPQDGSFINVFVDDTQREMMIAVDPKVYDNVIWGKKIAGLRVHLAKAKSKDDGALLRMAWERKAPKRLLRAAAAPSDGR